MRNLKRALSLALASVMLVGMMVVGTSAASYPDVDSNDNVEAISVLQAVGVMQGDADTGEFRPNDKVSRNEMAVIIARLLLGSDADDYVGTHPFTDVPAWADKYVAACYNDGIIKGMDDTTYGGSGDITAQQAAAMMLRALGYEKLEESGSDWARRVVSKANEIRLFTDVGSNPNAAMTRNQIAQLGLNTLKADVVTTTSGTNINLGDLGSITTDVKYETVDYTSEADNYSVASGNAGTGAVATDTGYGRQQLCEKLYGTDLRLLGSDSDDLGRPASKWVYDKDDVITISDDADYTIVVNEEGENASYWADKAKKNMTVKSGDVVTLNNGTPDAVGDIGDLLIGDVVEFYNVGDTTKDQADLVFVTRYSVGKITEVRECDPDVKAEKDAMEDDGAAYVVEIEMPIGGSKVEFFDTDINGFGSDYEEDAYIAYVEGDDDNLIASYIADTTDGKVTATGSDFIRVDGTKYTIKSGVTADLDAEYTFVLDSNGYIIDADEIEGADVALDEVYFVVGDPYTTSDTKYGKETVTMNIQVVAMDGTTRDFPLYSWTEKNSNNVYNDGTDEDLKGEIPDGSFFTNNHFIVLEENDDDDGYYDAKATVGEINDDYTAGNTAVVSSTSISLKTDTSSVGTGAGRVRLNSSTKYVIAESTGADLKVHTATGGVSFTGTSGDKLYAITEDVKGAKVALYVVMAVSDYDSSIDSDDVVYVDADADVEAVKVDGKNRYQFVIYDINGKEMEVISSVDISNGSNAAKTGFVTYSIKDEAGTDVYDFKAITDVSLSDEYDKQTGDKASNFASYFEDELTLSATYFVDIDTSGAVILDLHDRDGDYGKAIRSLEDMYNATDDGYTVALDVYLDDGAKMIVVTDVTKNDTRTEAGSIGNATATTVTKASDDGQTAAVTATITVTLADATADADNIVITGDGGGKLTVSKGSLSNKSLTITVSSNSDEAASNLTFTVKVTAKDETNYKDTAEKTFTFATEAKPS